MTPEHNETRESLIMGARWRGLLGWGTGFLGSAIGQAHHWETFLPQQIVMLMGISGFMMMLVAEIMIYRSGDEYIRAIDHRSMIVAGMMGSIASPLTFFLMWPTMPGNAGTLAALFSVMAWGMIRCLYPVIAFMRDSALDYAESDEDERA